MRDDFAAFILTHGRADRVITYNTLRKAGYTGKIVLIVDDEDEQQKEYEERYPGEVFVFPKQDAIDMTDSCDAFAKRNSVIFARNYTFEIARRLGLKYFIQLDDDYRAFYFTFDNERRYITRHRYVANMDAIFEAMIEFQQQSGAITVAMAQGGDFIGGDGSQVAKQYINGSFARKAMNSFICSVDRPFKFLGILNDDVNTYVYHGRKGKLFITLPRLRLEQAKTQTNASGLTDIYLEMGTYVKSFYTVICAPSCVTVTAMGERFQRLHHKISWKHACPKIISENVKKFPKNSK